MLPDVISEASLHSSVRREEIFSAFFVFGNKLAGGMTLAVSTGIYKYIAHLCTVCHSCSILEYSVPSCYNCEFDKLFRSHFAAHF